MPLKLRAKELDRIKADVLKTEGIKRMTRVRDACRSQSGCDGYMLSVEGPNPLRYPMADKFVTVITADLESIIDNAEHQRLISNFHLAAG